MDKNDSMINKLPKAFLDRMKLQLGSQYDAFAASYDSGRVYGLRYNPLKTDRESFLREMPFPLRGVPWAEEGFYYQASDQPGRYVLHEAGAYYIQEPSAMAVVPLLDPQPGERILDLCAAPGGKSTQIAGRMQGRGLLVSNEIIPSRARILSQNIERMGVANCVVCRESPDRIAAAFPAFFDRVLVDAPCSGEGMFRKDDTAIAEWSPENVTMCAARQRDIMEQAAMAVRPGGILVYSTCTFSREENEEVIGSFLDGHPEFSMQENGVRRFWPHLTEGEGHFAAKLYKAETAGSIPEKRGKKPSQISRSTVKRERFVTYLRGELGITDEGIEYLMKERVLFEFGDALCLMPEQMIPLKGLQVEKSGLQTGFLEKDRIRPSHALAMALRPEYTTRCYDMTADEAARYLQGETLTVRAELKGWYLLSCQGFSMGFGKASGGQMKNHYPKGLRRRQ